MKKTWKNRKHRGFLHLPKPRKTVQYKSLKNKTRIGSTLNVFEIFSNPNRVKFIHKG